MALTYFEKYCRKLSLSAEKDFSGLVEAHDFTSKKVSLIRGILNKRLSLFKGKFCVVAVGSYGRYEASDASDLDVYVIHEDGVTKRQKDRINEIIKKTATEAKVQFSTGFDAISLQTMHKNIGGKEDSNSSLTNRMLFLIESKCLYNDSYYSSAYNKILKKYLKDFLAHEKKAPRFLLNDLIRYYRTICVDYEFKTKVQNKNWAIRNIKLRFSRKGLYFGGVVILLNSCKKVARFEYLREHLKLSFADKIAHILLEEKKVDGHKDILTSYADFLKQISKDSIREHLKKLEKIDRESDKVFKQMANKGQVFNKQLSGLLVLKKWRGADYLDLLVF